MLYIVVERYYDETEIDSIHTTVESAMARIKKEDKDPITKDYSHCHFIQFWDMDKPVGEQRLWDYPEIKYWGGTKKFMCWFPPRTSDPFEFKNIQEYYDRVKFTLMANSNSL